MYIYIYYIYVYINNQISCIDLRASPVPAQDLHSALSAGLVVVEEIVADGFGVGNLKLTLRSMGSCSFPSD